MKTRASQLCLMVVASLLLAGCPAATTAGKKDSKPSTALESVAKAAADSGMDKESLLFAERLYKESPNNPEYIVNYARGLRRAGAVDAAKLVIRTPAKGKRATSEMMTEAAMVLIANGEYDEATGFAQKALEKSPKSPDAHHALALAMSGLGEHADAQLQFQKALDLWPEGRDQTPIINNLAMSMVAQGKVEEAKKVMALATGEALSSSTYQNNRALLGTLEDTEIKSEKLDVVRIAGPNESLEEAPQKTNKKTDKKNSSKKDDVKKESLTKEAAKPTPGKMMPIIE